MSKQTLDKCLKLRIDFEKVIYEILHELHQCGLLLGWTRKHNLLI